VEIYIPNRGAPLAASAITNFLIAELRKGVRNLFSKRDGKRFLTPYNPYVEKITQNVLNRFLA